MKPSVFAPAAEAPIARISAALDWRAATAVMLLAIGLYANTLSFDYALDDKLYITANEYTKKGFDGIAEIWTNDMMTGFFGKQKNLVEGGRYRPLSLTTHAIEVQFFGMNPQVSHFINVLLYAGTAWALLAFLWKLLGSTGVRWWWNVPIVATAIYIAHPLHVEVVANIKSRDEIMSLLFALLALLAAIEFTDRQNFGHWLAAAVLFLASLLSKESTVTLVAALPLALLFFRRTALKPAAKGVLALVTGTAVYLLIRTWGLGATQTTDVAKELMNQPYLLATEAEKYASILFTMGLYLKLLVWPHPLTHDYYPFHPFRTFSELEAGARPYLNWGDWPAALSLVVHLVLVVVALGVLMRALKGRGTLMGFALLFYLGTTVLFTNLVIDIGTFMNDRFMYIPSLAIALALAAAFVRSNSKFQPVAIGLSALVLLGFGAKTVHRNYAWENDTSLAFTDAPTSDGSAKVRMTMGSELLDAAKEETDTAKRSALIEQGIAYEASALKIYPSYFPPLDILGNLYFEKGDYASSVDYFKRAVKLKNGDERLMNNLEAVANVAAQKRDFEAAIEAYNALQKVRRGNKLADVQSALGEIYGKEMNDMAKSKSHLKKALEANDKHSGAWQKLGIVYAMSGQADSALIAFDKALSADPENANVLLNIGLLHQQLGNEKLGAEYLQRSKTAEKSNQKR